MAIGDWQMVFSGGQCSCTAEKIRCIRRCALQNFSPNEFGAHKFRHRPLAKASGMGRKILKGLHPALSTPHLYARLHACTLAHTLAEVSGVWSFSAL